MKYMLDTIDTKEILDCLVSMPVSGVTSNPSIIKKYGKIDFFPCFREIRGMLGTERSLHVQVTAPDAEGMIREAEAIHSRIDEHVYIKVPVNEAGLTAIRAMKQAGFPVTATGIYTKTQAFMALESGADYLAMYYNRMESLDIDAYDVFSSVAEMISRYSYKSEILGASFKNITQVNRAFEAGAQAVTVAPAILKDALRLPMIGKCVSDFASDWKVLYGERTIADL